MSALTRRPQIALSRFILRGERALHAGAGEAFLLLGIAAGSLLGLVSLLNPSL
ncbi:MAG: hypothetical protein J0L58_07495 [Burkholderiales bacterium]|uniref:hypothetical protein n=1 Tax=Inhella sp. TaxID=1921806 RepID=UPI001AC62C26|nr:hypothetical protein [Burkholderiales bacterium]